MSYSNNIAFLLSPILLAPLLFSIIYILLLSKPSLLFLKTIPIVFKTNPIVMGCSYPRLIFQLYMEVRENIYQENLNETSF